MIIDCIIIICALLCLFFIHKKYQTNIYNLKEYMLMGRSVTLPFFITSIVATWYGGIIGVTEIAYEHGIYNFVTQGIFWYLAYLFIAFFLVKKIRNNDCYTIPSIAEKFIGNKAKFLTSIFLYLKTLPVTYAFSIYVLTSFFFEKNIYLYLSITLFIAIYSRGSGLRALIYSDFLMFIFMITGLMIISIFSYLNFGPVTYLYENLPNKYFTINSNFQISTTIVWLFIAFATSTLNPTLYQRLHAAKSDKIAFLGVIIATIVFAIIDILITLTAMYAKASMPNLPSNQAYLSYGLSILPNGFRGLFFLSILATIVSSFDSFLNAAKNILIADLKLTNVPIVNYGSWAISILIPLVSNFSIYNYWFYFKSYFIISFVLPIGTCLVIKTKICENIFLLYLIIVNILMITVDIFNIFPSFYAGVAVFMCMMAINYFKKNMNNYFSCNSL